MKKIIMLIALLSLVISCGTTSKKDTANGKPDWVSRPPDTDVENGYDDTRYTPKKIYFLGVGELRAGESESKTDALKHADDQISAYVTMAVETALKKENISHSMEDEGVNASKDAASRAESVSKAVFASRREVENYLQEKDGKYMYYVLVSIDRETLNGEISNTSSNNNTQNKSKSKNNDQDAENQKAGHLLDEMDEENSVDE